MRFSMLCAAATGAGFLPTAWATTSNTLDALTSKSSASLLKTLEDRKISNSSASCNSDTVVVRKEWATLAREDKLAYISAVKCLISTAPGLTPLAAAPGVRNRFDDFGALHVNKTSMIHWTSYFYSWHRHYTWLYETALQEVCGYNGTQTYWDWSSTDTLAAHPLFDGSDTSLSGNGEYIPGHTTYVLLPTPNVTNTSIAPGSGGGCVLTGPFANHNVNLGPHGAPLAGFGDGLGYHLRCLTRDFRDWKLTDELAYSNVSAALSTPDLAALSTVLIALGPGLHDAGHQVVGGTQDDLWAAAQDPFFFFHHAQIDRVWALWQGLDQEVRTKEVTATLTIQNGEFHNNSPFPECRAI